MNSIEYHARTIASGLAGRAFAQLVEAGVDELEAANTAARVYDQEFRAELEDAYGEDTQMVREDLETFARCLEDDGEAA